VASSNPSFIRSEGDLAHVLRQFADALDISSLTEDGQLFGHPIGQMIQRLITHRLLELPLGSVLLVDLSNVRQASFAALWEVLSVLATLRSMELEQKYLLFHLNINNRDLVASLEILARDRKEVVPVINQTGSWHALGRLTVAERDTLAVVLEGKEITSTLLSERLHLVTSAASNRLRRLYELRLVQREERRIAGSGGREFIYRPLFSM